MIEDAKVLEDLFAPDGDAYEIREASRRKLLDASGSQDLHEIGFHRGVVTGLDLLLARVREREKQRRQTPPDDRKPRPTHKPPRRVH